MGTYSRNMKCCLLCKYWNGAIGSTTISVVPGGKQFNADNNERHSCFKEGRGTVTSAMMTCPYFKQRYEP